MKFLMGIKLCHSCEKREVCNLKNSKENLLEKPIAIPVIVENRFESKTVIRTTMCKDYGVE